MSTAADELPLRAEKLSKTYDPGLPRRIWGRLTGAPAPHPSLIDLDLTVHEGEILGFLGPNGAGKTTTIGLALGFLTPSSGSISIYGQAPGSRKALARIGYLPETSAFSKKLTGRELIEAFGRLRGLSKAEARSQGEALIKRVGMSHAPDRLIGRLSKGMARRIGIAAALIGGASFLIFDEPTSGLDPVGRRELKDLFIELKKEGRTILLCSHLLAEVEDVCDRIALLDRGRLIALGALDELLSQDGARTLTTEGADDEQLDRARQALGPALVSERQGRETLESFFVRSVGRGLDADQARVPDPEPAAAGGPAS